MTLLQWVVAIAALVASFLAGDALRAHERPTWPHAVAILALAVIGGLLESPTVVGAMLGAGAGWVLAGGVSMVREHNEAKARQLDGKARRRRANSRRRDL